MLHDKLGREIHDLRISVTDRCNFSCVYCKSADPKNYVPHRDLLTWEEFLRLSRVVVGLGIRKIRVTGGEPLLREGVVDFIARLRDIKGLEDVALTTNGYLLPEMARRLAASRADQASSSMWATGAASSFSSPPDEAIAYALVSFQRSPTPNHAVLLMRLLWRADKHASALEAGVQAVELDPMDVRLRLEYATMLVNDGRLAQAAQQVRIIRQIDCSRPADSDLRLTGKELAELDALADRAGGIRPASPRHGLQEHP